MSIRDAERRPLSRRQREVMQLLLKGARNEEIAASLGIGSETVKSHVSQLLRAFAAGDRLQLLLRELDRAHALARALADKVDQPLVVSDEAGSIRLINPSAARLGVAGTLLPLDLRRELRSRHCRKGLASLRGTFRGADLQWIVERAWIDERIALLLWRVAAQ